MATPEYEARHLAKRYDVTFPVTTLSSWPSTDYTTATTTGNSYHVGIPLASNYVGAHRR